MSNFTGTARISELYFDVSPKDQGQIVERGWIGVMDGFIRRCLDQSDGKSTYTFFPLADGAEGEFFACNGTPIQQGFAAKDGCREVTEAEVIQMAVEADLF